MSKVKCAAGLDSLNVREMADLQEIDIDKWVDVKGFGDRESAEKLLKALE